MLRLQFTVDSSVIRKGVNSPSSESGYQLRGWRNLSRHNNWLRFFLETISGNCIVFYINSFLNHYIVILTGKNRTWTHIIETHAANLQADTIFLQGEEVTLTRRS